MNVPTRSLRPLHLQLTDEEQDNIRERLSLLIRKMEEDRKQREPKKIQEGQLLPEDLFII